MHKGYRLLALQWVYNYLTELRWKNSDIIYRRLPRIAQYRTPTTIASTSFTFYCSVVLFRST